MWSAIANAVANLGSGILNYIGVKDTNKTARKNNQDTNASNLQISRETNQQNADLMREQNQWNFEQWQRENAYNSPLAQRARLALAGINQADIQAGQAYQLQSAQANPAVAAKMEQSAVPQNALGYLGQALGGSVNSFLQNLQQEEAVKQSKYQTQILGAQSQYALTHEYYKVQEEYEDLRQKKNLNSSDETRMRYLEDELLQLQQLRQKQLRQSDSDYDNSVLAGADLRERILTARQDRDFAAKNQKIHEMMSSQEFNVARAEERRINAVVSDIDSQIKDRVSRLEDDLMSSQVSRREAEKRISNLIQSTRPKAEERAAST